MNRVYSTDQGRICPGCNQSVDKCRCRNDRMFDSDGIVRISRETKGRKGKGVTLVSGVALPESELKALGKQLRQALSTGGSLKDGVLEFQGDHRHRLKSLLEQQGHRVKLAGG